jgi:hypothetical protein
VGRQAPPLVKICQKVSHSLDGIHDAVQLKLQAGLLTEETCTHEAMDRGMRGVVIIQELMERADQLPFPALADAEPSVRSRGSQVDEDATWLEDTMCLLQGMNHALMSHSSEDPGKDGYIERVVRVSQAFRMAHMISNAPGITVGEGPTGPADASGVRIERFDLPGIEGCQP